MFANIIVILLIGFLLVMAVNKIIKDRKKGKCSCGYNCSECALKGIEQSCCEQSSNFREFRKKRALEKKNKS
jgi:hypothetical protein